MSECPPSGSPRRRTYDLKAPPVLLRRIGARRNGNGGRDMFRILTVSSTEIGGLRGCWLVVALAELKLILIGSVCGISLSDSVLLLESNPKLLGASCVSVNENKVKSLDADTKSTADLQRFVTHHKTYQIVRVKLVRRTDNFDDWPVFRYVESLDLVQLP